MFCNHPDATKNIAAVGSATQNYTVLLHVLQPPKCDKEHFQVLPPEDKAHSYDGFASTKGKMVLPRTVLMEQLKKGEQLALAELRLRVWSVTKAIVNINGILREIDKTRIGETPFKWCLYMNNPIKLCTPLLKEMVRRWVGRNECFVLKQRMVPFTVGDVCMGLGLGVGGLDVKFDDNFGVSNMPFTILDNIENLYQYNWAKVVHTFVVNSLRNASRMIRQRYIKDSVGLSGNVAVLQLWAVQRLGLTDGPHHIVFPRIIKWPLVRLRSNKIEVLFKKKDICWEWFLREEDRQNLIIRAALQLDEGPIPQHGGHDLGMSWEEVVMKKIEDNQRKMVEMKKELKTLAAMVVVWRKRRTTLRDLWMLHLLIATVAILRLDPLHLLRLAETRANCNSQPLTLTPPPRAPPYYPPNCRRRRCSSERRRNQSSGRGNSPKQPWHR
ncbi:hypothetical protein LR48_Vigan08g137000 [Vigna angularis]|uniref:Aminotransferase-like plant mobile domain-containing protein n=1 Tax=Phaseolus angularis TaxID=3914 RepID=A0A0L9V6D1_PHAAN|nr:hypothetical protein LR48_Vigan08g137000 [Vigna angularis]